MKPKVFITMIVSFLIFAGAFFIVEKSRPEAACSCNGLCNSLEVSAAMTSQPEPKVEKQTKAKKRVKKIQRVVSQTVTTTPKPEKETTAIKVTFLELGSIGCIPCKMMQPIMKEIEEEYKEQVRVVFYDVWTPEGKPYARKYGVKAIPTQVFLDKDGNEYFRHMGFFSKDELVKVLRMKGVE